MFLALNLNPEVSIFGYILLADLPLYFYALSYLPNACGYLGSSVRRIFYFVSLSLVLGLVFLFYFGPGGYRSFLDYEAQEGQQDFFVLYLKPNGALWGNLLSLTCLIGYFKSRDDGGATPLVLFLMTLFLMPAVGMYIGILLSLVILPIWIYRFAHRQEIIADKAAEKSQEETDEYGRFKDPKNK